MPKEQFRTKDELARARWAEKFASVAKGKLYTTEGDDLSPFPFHKYFQNKLLGDRIKMLSVNAGAALVEHFVADTLTEFKITIGGEAETDTEKKITAWYKEVDYDSKEEEACRSLFGEGYGVQQLFRTVDGEANQFPVIAVSSSTWYPDIPTFEWQSVTSGRRITVFQEDIKGNLQWYAFVERHVPGTVSYQLLKLEHDDDLNGEDVGLGTISRFAGLKKEVPTDLEFIPIFQVNRQKASADTFGTSLLYAIWDILQEISETQTQIRQERIKHLRAKFAAPEGSLRQLEGDKTGAPRNFKQAEVMKATRAALYDMMQEIFPVPAGAQMPQYIQRDLESIRIGLELIESLKADAAAIVGCPKSVFNLEEAAGNVKVDTEKRKDRRYVRKIIQAQWQMARLREQVTKAWWKWSTGKDLDITIEFESPFNMTKEETVALMKQMNPMATLISEADAIEEVHKDKTTEERTKIIANIKSEKRQSALDNPSDITL